MKEEQNSPLTGVKRLSAFVIISILGILATCFTPVGRYFTVDNISRVAETLGLWGPVILFVAGIVSPLLFIPRWPIAFVSGLLYGVVWGTVLANVSSVCGAWLHFALAKTLLAPLSARLLRKYNMDPRSVPREKVFALLFFLRAFPLSNFVATNRFAGALKIPSRNFLLASFLGMIPSTIMYAAWGKLMKKPSGWFYALAAATLALIIWGTIVAHKKLQPWLKNLTKRP